MNLFNFEIYNKSYLFLCIDKQFLYLKKILYESARFLLERKEKCTSESSFLLRISTLH
jgi:hypothetical protein